MIHYVIINVYKNVWNIEKCLQKNIKDKYVYILKWKSGYALIIEENDIFM